MTIELLLRVYRSGALTASGVAAQVWELVSDHNVDAILKPLPFEVIDNLRKLISAIHSGAKMVHFDGGQLQHPIRSSSLRHGLKPMEGQQSRRRKGVRNPYGYFLPCGFLAPLFPSRAVSADSATLCADVSP
jgi:hypothetical protein